MASVAVGLLVAMAQRVPAHASPSGPGTDATVVWRDSPPRALPPLSGAEAQLAASKQQQAHDRYAAVMARRAAGVQSATDYTTYNLGEPYYQQINEVYCGPATVVMVADYLGTGWTGQTSTYQQKRAAYWLGTTSDGTAWYGAVDNVPYYPGTSMYPVVDVLNYTLHVHNRPNYYVPVNLPDSPTAAQQNEFVSDLYNDITNHHPEADNQYSITNYNLPYQPNQPWHHWWSARGYENFGYKTGINDPASFGSSGEKWVTTKGGAHTVVVALGGRGYIW